MSSSSNRAADLTYTRTPRRWIFFIAAAAALTLNATARAEVELAASTPALRAAATGASNGTREPGVNAPGKGSLAQGNGPLALNTDVLDPASAATLNIAAVGLNTAAVGITEKDKAARPKPQPASSLRCWQYGRLLFEENNLASTPATLAGAQTWVRTPPADSTGKPLPATGAVHLLHLGDALCLFTGKGNGG